MKGGLSKEVVSDEGEVSMGHIYICNQKYRSYNCIQKKEVVFHEGGLSNKVPLYIHL